MMKNKMKILQGREWYSKVYSPPIFLENVTVAGK
jgi:hypothetical protein